MEENQVWCDTNFLPELGCDAGSGGRRVEAMRRRKGQNFSIERILGRVRDGHEEDEEEEEEEEEERLEDHQEEEGQEEGMEEGDDHNGEEDEDETFTNEELQLKKENATAPLLNLSANPQPHPTSNGRVVQAILPRPPPLLPPPSTSTPPFFPRTSPFSQDPFLLTSLQSSR